MGLNCLETLGSRKWDTRVRYEHEIQEMGVRGFEQVTRVFEMSGQN